MDVSFNVVAKEGEVHVVENVPNEEIVLSSMNCFNWFIFDEFITL